MCLLALKLARELDRRLAPLGLAKTSRGWSGATPRGPVGTLGQSEIGLWRLPTSYPAAQSEVLAVLPKLKPPLLSLEKANKRRLTNPRNGRG